MVAVAAEEDTAVAEEEEDTAVAEVAAADMAAAAETVGN